MKFSQTRAIWAITKGSLRAITRSPSAVIFSFAFPFIFILVFGFVGDSGKPIYKIAIDPRSDTNNALFQSIAVNPSFRLVKYDDERKRLSDMEKGKLAAYIIIQKTADSITPYKISLHSYSSSDNKWPQVRSLLMNTIQQLSDEKFSNRPAFASFDFDPKRDITVIREYKTIDFILPGQLGFSLLSSGVFGVAFMFFSLRNNLVLKRFFATPISKTGIILGEGISRVIFQMTTALVIILCGYFFFGFTLVDGWITFLQMLCLSFFGLVIFMGFGFIISGLAKNESSIPPLANIITLPQFLLGGTFFDVDVFPKWLQPIANMLPLTHLNGAMRSIAFEGMNLWEVRGEVLILLVWGIVAYAAAVKLFRWE